MPCELTKTVNTKEGAIMNKKDKERIQEVLDKNRNSIECVSRMLVTRIVLTAGDGSNENPGRFEEQYWTDDGELLSRKIVL